MNNNPASYSEGSWFKCLPGDRLSWYNISPISSVFSLILGYYLKLGQSSFLQYLFYSIIYSQRTVKSDSKEWIAGRTQQFEKSEQRTDCTKNRALYFYVVTSLLAAWNA